jgi:glycosyltransferase involved in cell wall biosynthesis
LFATAAFLAWRGRSVGVVHGHGLVAAFVGRLLKPIFRKRTLATAHSVFHLAERPALARKVGWIFRGLDGVFPLAPGASSRGDLHATGLDEDRLFTAVPWVDLERFHPEGPRSDRLHELASTAVLRLLSVGRLYDGKGILELAQAVNRCASEVHLFVVGSGPLEAALQATNRGRIHLLGRLGQEQLPAYYRAADLTAVPSLVPEGFSRVAIEALACGCPVLVSTNGDLPEMVTPEVGWVVEPTPEQLAALLERLAASPGELTARRPLCRSYAENRFNRENVEAILRAYFPTTE